MPDISDILKRAKRREKIVHLCLAGDEVAEIEGLERQLTGLADTWQPDSLAATDPREKIAKQIKAARERMRKAEVAFKFRAVGAKEWSDLLAAHPGKSREQIWDPETFPKALVGACCVDPEMLPTQVEELFEVLNEGQRNDLMNAAYEVNAEATHVPFSVSASSILSSLSGGK